nr:hypothetical protein [Nitrospirota bacterium]
MALISKIREKVRNGEFEFADVAVPPEDLDDIEKAEQLRHLFVHSGGRVSQQYLDRTNRTDVQLGEAIVVNEDYLLNVRNKVALLCSDVFMTISKKFFRKTDRDLTGVPRRPSPNSIEQENT